MVTPTLVYKWLFFYCFLSHCFWPTKAAHIEVIVPYFVYCEDRSRKKTTRSLFTSSNLLNKYIIQDSLHQLMSSLSFASLETDFLNYILFHFIFSPQLFRIRTCVPCLQVATPLILFTTSLPNQVDFLWLHRCNQYLQLNLSGF